MNPLTEKYRPQSWPEVIGQDAAVARAQLIIDRGIGTRRRIAAEKAVACG